MRVELLEAGKVPARITLARAFDAEERIARFGPHSCCTSRKNIIQKNANNIQASHQ